MRRGILAAPDVDRCAGCAVLAARVSTLQAQVLELLAERDERLRRRLLPDDPSLLARLLPAISGQWGHDEFVARHIAEDPRAAAKAEGRSVKALGKLFARAVGVPIGLYVLVDCGWNDEEGVRRYRVDGVSRGL